MTDDDRKRRAHRARKPRTPENLGWLESIETPAGTVRITTSQRGKCRIESNAGRCEFQWKRHFPRLQRRATIVGTGLPDAFVTRAGVARWYPSRILRVRSGGIEWRWRRTGFARYRITTANGRVIAEYKRRDLRLATGLSLIQATLAVACATSGIDYWTVNTVELLLDGL